MSVRKIVRVRNYVRNIMATINYYLDKQNKNGLSPIHLRINCDKTQVKISTSIKVSPKHFDKKNQIIRNSVDNHKSLNYFLSSLKEKANELLNPVYGTVINKQKLKNALLKIVENYKKNNNIYITEEQMSLYGSQVTFIDLFAGAGGFSEGFLQSEVYNKYFDFVLANDVNENCELTHLVRYNHQLNLEMQFLKQDVTEPDFIDNLITKIGNKKIDVVCGGPPCQSFSLAGKRKKYDKKDDLFSHYLEVIKVLQPKYFVMENVKGILTKDKGKIKDRIINEINSIIDIKEVTKLTAFINKIKSISEENQFILECLIKRIEFERHDENENKFKHDYIRQVENKFKKISPQIVDYKTSKTDIRINTIRHGFNLLINIKNWEKLKRDIIKEKDSCDIDGDLFSDPFNSFLKELESDSIINKIAISFNDLNIKDKHKYLRDEIILALKIFKFEFSECVNILKTFCNEAQKEEIDNLIEKIRLYKIEQPFILNASDYGVPQNRERVIFIGCRKDQKFISKIPKTTIGSSKVTTFEALYDLDFISNNQEVSFYKDVNIKKQFNGTAEDLDNLIKNRDSSGKITKSSKTYADWSKSGRLNGRFKNANKPFFVKSISALEKGEKNYSVLHNHKTSNQKEEVIKRLQIILKNGDYKKSQDILEKVGLSSNKRNYNVLKPEKQSPTILTIPDDYIHYNSPRALTVREMARLQSFDDSFVFQGKRSTGGNKRKIEVPQYTLVGNAIPPLLAKAIATEILKYIK